MMFPVNRRRFLASVAAATAPLPNRAAAQTPELPLSAYDPYGPLDDSLDRLFDEVFVAKDGAGTTVSGQPRRPKKEPGPARKTRPLAEKNSPPDTCFTPNRCT